MTIEDSQWKDSAAIWEAACKKANAERDALEEKLGFLRDLALKVRRGCDCDYDYRCSNCQAVVALKKALESCETRRE